MFCGPGSHVFTVTFDQSSAHFLNISINFGQINKNLTNLKLLNISVTMWLQNKYIKLVLNSHANHLYP